MKICKVCKNEFECYDRAGMGRRVKSLRRSNCLTCSTECSKENISKNRGIKLMLEIVGEQE